MVTRDSHGTPIIINDVNARIDICVVTFAQSGWLADSVACKKFGGGKGSNGKRNFEGD